MLHIIYFENKYQEKWDDYVKESSSGTFFHLTGWKDNIEKTFRLKPVYLMAIDEYEVIKGIMPLFLMNDILGRKYLVSLPYSTYAGICADDKETGQELFNKAKELAVEYKVQHLELRHQSDEFFQLPTKKDFVSMLLRLETDEDHVWKTRLNSKVRNQVRKAYKEGLTVDFGKEYLDDFYEILSANIRDLGSPNYPKSFLENLLEEFNDSSGIIVVKYRNKVIAGMLFVHYKNLFLDPWAASLKKYNKLCPNNILYWEAIKYACAKGCEFFDLGRSTMNSGTFKFKKQWGAETVQLHYQYFLNKADRVPEVSAHNNKYEFAIDLWKKLPLPVVKCIGPKLIKYLPEL